jgi:hypothetical protein
MESFNMDSIIIKSINKITNEPDNLSDRFRIIYFDKNQRHTIYCEGIEVCLSAIKEIINDRINGV